MAGKTLPVSGWGGGESLARGPPCRIEGACGCAARKIRPLSSGCFTEQHPEGCWSLPRPRPGSPQRGAGLSDPLSPLVVWPVTAPRHPEPWGGPTEFRPRFRIHAKQPVVSLGYVSSFILSSCRYFFILFLTLLLPVFPVRTEVMFMATRELLRIPQAALAKPISIPTNLVSLFSRYVDRQKLNLLETKLQ